MQRAHNFSAGPAILPIQVLEETAQAVLNYNNLGMSIMEMSHRSKEYDAVFIETQLDGLKVMGLSPDEYDVLFLGGGASTQFLMIAYNFLKSKADYINTGIWAKKAIKEAKWVGGDVKVVASSEDTKFNYIPKNVQFSPDADYVHITTNNTVEGTWYPSIPDTGSVPLIGDLSSEFLSREMDYSKFDLIYAGAQKNIGPAGVTMVVIKKSLMERWTGKAPTMLDYKIHLENGSMYNTPPCLPVYVINRVFKWILNQGGLPAVEATNKKKGYLLYDYLDANSDFYIPQVKTKEDRSLMNVCWNLTSEELESKFCAEAKKRYNMTNLKGHRSVGGIRASIYNACPIESVEALITYMGEFMKENK
ncbi:MAG: 3-phosphoserine/phosphohydroxythreonine transaminase [Candidatus Kapabacteria bacterium]|nr:3-phosphoserine/phosphohydroxythreonine transaminase [Candidatus Kapabacteria bacterium]